MVSQSLFEIYRSREKEPNATKYLTEKKRNHTVARKRNNKPDSRLEESTNRKPSLTKNEKPVVNQVAECEGPLMLVASCSKSSMNKTLKHQEREEGSALTKEELIATLLSKKEAKLRECTLSIQQKEEQFATQLEQMQSAHEQDMATIKQEVQGVL
jgi:hypothetical protein